jgi:hypothetical protein
MRRRGSDAQMFPKSANNAKKILRKTRAEGNDNNKEGQESRM